MLQSADHVYRIIIEHMREGAALVSEEGTVLYANRALGSLLGVPADKLVSEAITEFVDDASRVAVEEMAGGTARRAAGTETCSSGGPTTAPCPCSSQQPTSSSRGAGSVRSC